MTTVGVRELRRRASELLRMVAAGETTEITDRGRPIAILGPLPALTGLDPLRATGEANPAELNLDDLPEPITVPTNEPSASDVLAHLRADER